MISIHAPTRGATLSNFFHNNNYPHFNPRSHKGSDNTRSNTNDTMYDFNPRSHKGSDRFFDSCPAPLQKFQSTLPQGERQKKTRDACKYYDFNPRSHKGSDTKICLIFTNVFDFNPRSHKGSDGTLDSYIILLQISIHAPTRGATI